MRVVLHLPDGKFEQLDAHLLPDGCTHEQAAFLFVHADRGENGISLRYIANELLHADDFETQEDDYLELTSETRARLIKRAHDLDASLVEIHSHPFPWPAEFSMADRLGLQETVPHMFWRLNNRPYAAVVVAPGSFDALVWVDDPGVPNALSGILAGDRPLRPTDRSLGGWDG